MEGVEGTWGGGEGGLRHRKHKVKHDEKFLVFLRACMHLPLCTPPCAKSVKRVHSGAIVSHRDVRWSWPDYMQLGGTIT